MSPNLSGMHLPYQIHTLTEDDLEKMYSLCKANKIYYEHMRFEPTCENLRESMTALPQSRTLADKHFVGFFENGQLLAILDLIENYPDQGTAWIGWLITDTSYQRSGLGTTIVKALCSYLKQNHFHTIALAYIKGNPQSEHFWLKQGFQPYGDEVKGDLYTMIKMQKYI